MMKVYTLSWHGVRRKNKELLEIFHTREQATEAAVKLVMGIVNNNYEHYLLTLKSNAVKMEEQKPFDRGLVTIINDCVSYAEGWWWQNDWYRVDEYEVQGGEV